MLKVHVSAHAIERGRVRAGISEQDVRESLAAALRDGRTACRRPRWLPTRRRRARRFQSDPRYAWPESRRYVILYRRHRELGYVAVTVLTRREPDESWDVQGDDLDLELEPSD